MTEWVPTKAESENPDDCYGRHHDPAAPECKRCLVQPTCAVDSLSYVPVDPTNLPPTSIDISSDTVVFGRFVPGSAAKIAHNTILLMPVAFDFDSLMARFVTVLRDNNIQLNDAEKTLRRVLNMAIRADVLVRTSKSSYKRLK